MSDARRLLDLAKNQGYYAMKLLATGEMAALSTQLFTVGIIVFNQNCILKRWCFEEGDEALASLRAWEGVGDPPGNWVKQKLPVERMNPNWSRA